MASICSSQPIDAKWRAKATAMSGVGQAYVAKSLAAGDTKTEAIRVLRRRLSDEVFRRLQADEAARVATETLAQAAA